MHQGRQFRQILFTATTKKLHHRYQLACLEVFHVGNTIYLWPQWHQCALKYSTLFYGIKARIYLLYFVCLTAEQKIQKLGTGLREKFFWWISYCFTNWNSDCISYARYVKEESKLTWKPGKKWHLWILRNICLSNEISEHFELSRVL